MPDVLKNIITDAVADPDDRTVAVTWANGDMTITRFGHPVGKGVFAAFADPAFFAQVSVGDRGRSLGRATGASAIMLRPRAPDHSPVKPLAPAAKARHLAVVRNIEPQEGCVTAIDPHRSRGPWNAPQHAVAGRVEGRI